MMKRRLLLRAMAALFVALLAPSSSWARRRYAEALQGEADELEGALRESSYVYVSPLHEDGRESTCHGEIWFAWLDGAVVTTVATTTWKARAHERGLRGARIWVGDHGRVKGLLGENQAFRKAPHFDARAERSSDPELFDRLLAQYARKYPAEIGRWKGRMAKGQRDGSRVTIRYVPVSTKSPAATKG